MSYLISTWLDSGEPRLGIVDTETGEIMRQWQLVRIDAPGIHSPPRTARAAAKIQQLTHRLFLLCCAEDLALTPRCGHGRWDDCLQCDRCTDASGIGGVQDPSAAGVRVANPDSVVKFAVNRRAQERDS